MKDTGRDFREWREALGIALRRAAADMGMPATTLSAIERGVSEPNSTNYVKMMSYMNSGIDVNTVHGSVPDWLFGSGHQTPDVVSKVKGIPGLSLRDKAQAWRVDTHAFAPELLKDDILVVRSIDGELPYDQVSMVLIDYAGAIEPYRYYNIDINIYLQPYTTNRIELMTDEYKLIGVVHNIIRTVF